MPRKRRPLDRTAGVLRDTSIIVVACEDMYAAKQYFAKFRTRRTQFKVLPTEHGKSSPRAVIERLHSYRAEYAQEEGDELWICIDADHWIRGNHQRELSQVLQECRQNDYHIAISNPCFEVWLLLHFSEINNTLLSKILAKDPSATISTEEIEALGCEQFASELRAIAGGYTKKNVSALRLSPTRVLQATERARNSDSGIGEIPQCPGTRVYKLIDTLLRRDSIDLEE